ncbi:MAG: 50S ribosomal protein L6 [Elusimicrobiota bacterium]|nr:50S ribosomal protein L6 [Elusimicrobiota bacterium]
MSKLARKPIIVPEKVKVELKVGDKGDNTIEISGPLGKVTETVHPRVKVELQNSKIFVNRSGNDRANKMFQGLMYSLIRNAVLGVTAGFKKELEIRGVGYQAQVSDNELVLRLGFSHPVKFKIPQDIKLTTDQKGTIITVFGIDKQLVGETAARIRRIKPPESYKGMGIRYVDERVIKKVGKTAVSVTAGAKK